MSTAVFGAPEWWARSGRTIKPLADGTLTFQGSHGYLAPKTAMDAEEYFQAKRDDDLGRWRCPTDLDWVAREGVRTAGGRTVVVVNERTLDRFWFSERIRDAAADVDVAHRVGRAYFEAHPERKPWAAADPGEVWVLTTADGRTLAYAVLTAAGRGVVFERKDWRYNLDDDQIKSGRRIWPEDAS